MVAVIARPSMADASGDVERGFLGNKQHAAATRASRPAKTMGRNVLDAGTMDAHRRSSSTLPPHPELPENERMVPMVCGAAATPS